VVTEETYRRVIKTFGEAPASEYRYPDPAEQLDESVFPIEKRPEEHARWRQMVDRAFGGERPHPGLALDAGCGLGTHTRALAEAFSFVISIDADPRRLAIAQRNVPSGSNFGFFALPLEHPAMRDSGLDAAFHFVHCVQVLGHVPEKAVPPILESFSRMLAPGGALFLAVPFTNQPFDEHWMVRALDGGKVSSAWTTPDSYDSLAAAPPNGLLPVRHFSLPSIKTELARAKLVFEAAQPYNWFDKRRADIFILARKPVHQ
jgi:SAM-dependent methyltransferase